MSMKSRRAWLLQGLGWCAIAAPVPGWARDQGPPERPPEDAGAVDPAPLFAATLYDLDNQPIPFARYKGLPLVVNFWARWCAPCRVEIPELVALQQRRTGVSVVGINLESTPDPVADFARAYEINYPILLTRNAGIPLLRALGNAKAGLPFTLVLNRDGVVVASRMGVITRQQLDVTVVHALR